MYTYKEESLLKVFTGNLEKLSAKRVKYGSLSCVYQLAWDVADDCICLHIETVIQDLLIPDVL